MISNEIFLVRHGEYTTNTMELNSAGKEQARVAAEKLVSLLKGTSAVIVSSDRIRCAQTAEIIGEHLNLPVTLSSRLVQGGNHPQLVQNIGVFIAECLHDESVDFTPDTTIIAVAHAPIIQAVNGYDLHEVAYGGIYPANPGWVNPDYNAAWASKEFSSR